MRSLIFALALAAPISAVAATRSYSNPLSNMHHQQQQQEVFLTFVNNSVQDREVVIGDHLYKLQFRGMVHVHVAVGTPVFVYSEMNSKVNGQELMLVSAIDQDKRITLL
jgi:ADP-glucose pyrophosphorylase